MQFRGVFFPVSLESVVIESFSWSVHLLMFEIRFCFRWIFDVFVFEKNIFFDFFVIIEIVYNKMEISIEFLRILREKKYSSVWFSKTY